MANDSTLETIKQILTAAGPTFYGSAEQLDELAAEWDDRFAPAAVRLWVDAGCFDAMRAEQLAEADVLPRDVAPTWRDGMQYGYAFANGDISLDKLQAEIAALRAEYDV